MLSVLFINNIIISLKLCYLFLIHSIQYINIPNGGVCFYVFMLLSLFNTVYIII